MAAKKTVKSKAGSDNDVGEIEDTSADLVLDPRVEVSLATLERGPQRVTKFLAAMAASGQIRALMAERGWSEAKMLEGRSLLMDLLVPAPSAEQLRVQNAGTDSDQKVVAAQKSLNALDEGHFEIAQTALLYNHPAVYDFVFHNLAATTDDAQAVAGWRTFLTRVAILRSGEGRESTKKDDQAALARPRSSLGLTRPNSRRIEDPRPARGSSCFVWRWRARGGAQSRAVATGHNLTSALRGHWGRFSGAGPSVDDGDFSPTSRERSSIRKQPFQRMAHNLNLDSDAFTSDESAFVDARNAFVCVAGCFVNGHEARKPGKLGVADDGRRAALDAKEVGVRTHWNWVREMKGVFRRTRRLRTLLKRLRPLRKAIAPLTKRKATRASQSVPELPPHGWRESTPRIAKAPQPRGLERGARDETSKRPKTRLDYGAITRRSPASCPR